MSLTGAPKFAAQRQDNRDGHYQTAAQDTGQQRTQQNHTEPRTDLEQTQIDHRRCRIQGAKCDPDQQKQNGDERAQWTHGESDARSGWAENRTFKAPPVYAARWPMTMDHRKFGCGRVLRQPESGGSR